MNIDVNNILEQLATGFNVAVEQLYPILYKQAIIDGVFNLIWSIVFIVLIAGFVFVIKFVHNKQKLEKDRFISNWDWDAPRQLVILIIGGFITLIGLFVIPIGIESAITAFFNTEYYMIKDILSQLNGSGS